MHRKYVRIAGFLAIPCCFFFPAHVAKSAVIKADFATKCPVMDPGKFGQTVIGASFVDGQPHGFGSIAAPEGSVIGNSTNSDGTAGSTITGFTMTLPAGSTWDPASTGGDLFNAPTLSNGNRTITFKGGSIKVGQTFWSMIPKVPDGTVGTVLTAAAPNPNPPQIIGPPANPQIGTRPLAGTVTFDGSNRFSIDPAAIFFAEYLDGSIVTGSAPFESLLGASINIDPFQLIGASASVAGAYQLSDSEVTIDDGSLFSASLTDVLLIPDGGAGGLSDRIQASLSFTNGLTDAGSQFVDQLLGIDLAGGSADLYIDSSILAATGNLNFAGRSSATETIGTPTPEPSGFWAMGGALLILSVFLRGRQNILQRAIRKV
jgi:hypothetical protein